MSAPVYSHLAYDVVPGQFEVVRNPDVVIVEGLNVLQAGSGVFVSDFFDFSIYVDAQESDIELWYIERFLMLRETVFRDPSSYFHRYAVAVGRRGARDGPATSGRPSIWSTCGRTCCRRVNAPISFSRKGAITRSGG